MMTELELIKHVRRSLYHHDHDIYAARLALAIVHIIKRTGKPGLDALDEIARATACDRVRKSP